MDNLDDKIDLKKSEIMHKLHQLILTIDFRNDPEFIDQIVRSHLEFLGIVLNGTKYTMDIKIDCILTNGQDIIEIKYPFDREIPEIDSLV